MGRYTHEEMRSIVKPIATKLAEGISEGLMQFLSEADLKGLGLGEAKTGEAKTKTPPPKEEKEDFVGQAKLVKALKGHYVDFAGSKLAEASRKRTATKKNPKGRCGLYSLVLTWASLNKNVACREWAERKGSSKQLRKWYNML